MEFIASRESLRINFIALYSLLPQYSHEMLAKLFSDIARVTFSQLDQFMYAKMTGSNTRFHSPSQMNSEKCTFPYGGTQTLK